MNEDYCTVREIHLIRLRRGRNKRYRVVQTVNCLDPDVGVEIHEKGLGVYMQHPDVRVVVDMDKDPQRHEVKMKNDAWKESD